MGPWHQVGAVWERHFDGGIAAYVRTSRYRWERERAEAAAAKATRK